MDLKSKTKSIQFNLFSTYSLIIIFISIIFVASFYFYVSNLLRENTFTSMEDISGSISQKLDLEIQKLDNLSMNVLYSNLVKEKFQKYLSYTEDIDGPSENIKVDRYNNLKTLINVLVAIIGPSQTVQQVNLYDFKGGMIGAGVRNEAIQINVKQKSWYDEVIAREGKKYLSPPHKDPFLGKVINHYKDKYYLSLPRVYFDQYNIKQGIVEVIQDCDDIFNSLDEMIAEDGNNKRIYVYGQEGELIYPYKSVSRHNYNYYYKIIKNNPQPERYFNIKNPENGEKELFNYTFSDYTGWTVAVVAPEEKLLAPLFTFTKFTFIGTIVILVLALGLSFVAARKITVPISRIHETMKSMDLEMISDGEHKDLNSGLNELEELNVAFQQMSQKLKRSMQKLLLSQSHEMQARMLALQSQMNPHFLYNSLANISIMAEENMNEQIVTMCENLSYMLRYISSDGSSLVKVATEVEYTEKYLACMKVRYGDNLQYQLDIDEGLKEIKIPKLVIQPLVENAVKYGSCNEPPWVIKVNGIIKGDYWQIIVKDNGPGFSQAEIDNFRKKVQEMKEKDSPPGLELEGMGLLNIYMRLQLAYEKEMKFEIKDNFKNGASVIIGGTKDVEKNKEYFFNQEKNRGN